MKVNKFFKRISITDTISANSLLTITETDLSENDILKHQYFNEMDVFNESPVDIVIRLNGSNNATNGNIDIPAGSSKTIKENFRRPTIFNADSSLDTDGKQIILQIKKVVG